MEKISVKNLIDSGAHFGHLTPKWNPRMKEFIYGKFNGTHIIDVRKTVTKLEEAYNYAAKIGSEGGRLLYVGTKHIATEIVKQHALESGNFFVNSRWLGGTLTNFQTIKQSILRLSKIEDIAGKDLSYPGIIKKEAVGLEKQRQKMINMLGGFRHMKKMPSAVFIIDVNKERIALQECHSLNIPVIAITDSNANPTAVAYPIPANDDSKATVEVITRAITVGYLEGRKFFETQKVLADSEDDTADVTKSFVSSDSADNPSDLSQYVTDMAEVTKTKQKQKTTDSAKTNPVAKETNSSTAKASAKSEKSTDLTADSATKDTARSAAPSADKEAAAPQKSTAKVDKSSTSKPAADADKKLA